MNIIRDGKEIELTFKEARNIWMAYENEIRREDIESRYEVPCDKVDEAIELLSLSIEHNDYYWDLYWGMVDYVAQQYGFKEI